MLLLNHQDVGPGGPGDGRQDAVPRLTHGGEAVNRMEVYTGNPLNTRGIEPYVLRVRAHENAAGQVVSLLDLNGLSPADPNAKRRLAALWKCNITTADELDRAIPDTLAQRLREFRGFSPRTTLIKSWIRGCKAQIDRLRLEREIAVPLGSAWVN